MPRLRIGDTELAYREQGEQRPALLFIHGAGGSSAHFKPLMGLLGQQMRAVALDLPGHGRSPALVPPPSPAMLLEIYRDLAAGAAEKLGLGRFVVAGHSMGGAVAQLFALRYPEQVAGVVLLATAARLKVAPPVIAAIRDNFQGLAAMMAAVGYSPSTDPARARALAEAQIQAPQEVVLADFRACAGFDLRTRVGELNSAPFPTTIISASDDMLTPPKLQCHLAGLIPRAEVVTITRAGHFCFMERPDAVAEAMLAAHARAQTGPRIP